MPGSKLGNEYKPAASVVLWRTVPVATEVKVSSTPAITAPEGSVTVPVSVALRLCAQFDAGKSAIRTRLNINIINIPLPLLNIALLLFLFNGWGLHLSALS